ncbi:F-box protein CPR1-like isoform X1 [Quercus robur]|uniref:F-box protein CPR1-like isoform X1 n=1 Tax=Quercus robur TaxID=38942 RepID=UPI002163C09A|nr:F-box protein CPR1-like isoform X1 [Quercus robur]
MSDNTTTNLIIIPWESLPDEILTNIFVFLPIKSIIICTSVSKAWKSLIKNPTFISTHLHHSLNKNQNLLFISLRSENQKEFYALHNEDDADLTQHARFDYPFHAPDPHNKKCIVVGSCNGLLFLSNFFRAAPNNGFYLWNPCVGKLLKLPSPNVTYATHGAFRGSSGFGFDPKTKDYKVVSVVTLLENFDLGKTRPQVEIYTLSTGQWRMLRTGLAPICVLLRSGPQTFINGALHWVAFRVSDNNLHNFVLVFDLGEEDFHEILLPEFPGHVGLNRLMSGSVSVYRNSIAFFRQDNDFLHMWAMKEYGVVSSWTKVFRLPLSNLDFFGASDSIQRALGFRRNGEVILKLDGGRLISLDLETGEFKDLRIMGYKKTIVDYHVESLVLLDKAANSEDTY